MVSNRRAKEGGKDRTKRSSRGRRGSSWFEFFSDVNGGGASSRIGRPGGVAAGLRGEDGEDDKGLKQARMEALMETPRPI